MRSWALIGLGLLTAAAVLGMSLQGGQAGVGQHSRPDATTAAKDARRVAARPYVGKPRPPVRVMLSGKPVLEAGVAGTLRLGIRAAVPVTGLSLLVEGDDGLTVTGMEALSPGAGLPAGQGASLEPGLAAEYRVHAVPSSGGLRSLSGQLRFMVGGVEQAAPFRIAVSVNGPLAMPDSFQQTGSPAVMQTAGEPVVSMKAETMVR